MGGDRLTLTAHAVSDTTGYTLTPMPRRRAWMDATGEHFANRCLPLVMANQAGWAIRTKNARVLIWTGGPGRDALRIGGTDATASPLSHFGHGVATWPIPWLFRTPEGWDLWVDGPPNEPLDGVCYLSGLVETDHAHATFTANWRLTRPGAVVVVPPDAMICRVVPVPAGWLDGWALDHKAISDTPHLEMRHKDWSASRSAFNARLESREPEATREAWQKDYHRAAHRRRIDRT